MHSVIAADPLPVLVVDDDSALIRTLADILRHHGYAPQTALSGSEGLALARDRAPALAVVDLRLPDMDGVELASRLHALSELTQVVVLTGNASVESAVAAMREHSIDYLVKPVQIDRLLQVVSMATERWQRKNAEEKLRQSDERFRRVVESNMLGIMFFDRNDDIYDANDAFLAMLRYSRGDVDAGHLNWRELTAPEYDELDEGKARDLRRHGVVAAYQKELVRKDGSRVPVLLGAALLDGRDKGGVSFVLDMSARRAAENALAARARQQEAIAAFGQRALAVDDVGELIDEATSLVALTLDVPMSSLFERRADGQSLTLRSSVGFTGVTPAMQLPITETTLAGSTVLSREPLLVRDLSSETRFPGSEALNKYRARSAIAVVVPGPVHPFGVLQVFDVKPRDFTQDDVNFLTAIAHVVGTSAERHRTERAFRQSQRLEAVGRLASGVAHDFNNMLSAITSYTELVLQTVQEGDPRRGDLREILSAAERAAGLTHQLLAFSREQPMKPRLLSLNDVIVGMEKMVRRLIGPEIELSLHLDPDVEWVKADPTHIEQVVLNLCVNARDAMPAGGRLTIETCNTTLDSSRTAEHSIEALASGEFVMLAVTDTGTGMDAETRARIFEPFFTTKSPDKGTGLGLATVYGIVKQSSGEIFVYSEPGHGTTFKVFLPRSMEMGATASTKPEATRAVGTVLLAEDQDVIRRATQRNLERAGYDVVPVRDGADALRILEDRRSPVDLLITDMIMPGMTGDELARRARRLRPELPVLFLSGFTAASMPKSLGPSDFFLPKPFGGDALVAKAREALNGQVKTP